MYLAIAVEHRKHTKTLDDYRVWYLELNSLGDVVGIGVKEKKKLVEHIFENYKKFGQSNWQALPKNAENPIPIEIFNFISRNEHYNTHFGNLPYLEEFQSIINTLQSRLELRSIASWK